jgi:hypothetical protein
LQCGYSGITDKDSGLEWKYWMFSRIFCYCLSRTWSYSFFKKVLAQVRTKKAILNISDTRTITTMQALRKRNNRNPQLLSLACIFIIIERLHIFLGNNCCHFFSDSHRLLRHHATKF